MQSKNYFYVLAVLAAAVFTCCKPSRTDIYTMKLHIEGKKFEFLMLSGVVAYRDNALAVEGKTDNGYDWTFEIPNSILDSVQWFSLKTGRYNAADTTIYRGKFIIASSTDTLFSGEIPAREQKRMIYYLKYLETEKHKDEYAIVDDTIFLDEYNDVIDIFEVQKLEENSELALIINNHLFGLIDESKDYNKQVQNFINVANSHPNSQYLMSSLWGWTRTFKSSADIEKIFNRFSEGNKKSFFGKQLYAYLHPVFENIRLPRVDNIEVIEPLIQDSTKYNLIELTASWCAPCRDLQPSLVELGKQYKDKLIITYVTIDDEQTIDDFKQLIEKEHINWRCLWLRNNKGYLNRLGRSGIPSGVLYSPDSKIIMLQLNLSDDLVAFHKVLEGK